MTKKDIAKGIATKYGVDHAVAKHAVQHVFDSIVEALQKHGRMELRNFGVFEVKRRAARVARNPRTNQQVSVPAKTVVVFHPGKNLADLFTGQDVPGSALRTGTPLAEGGQPDRIAEPI